MRLFSAAGKVVPLRINQLDALARVLAAVGPEAPLVRGYALVRDSEGRVVSSVAGLAGRLTIKVKDGEKEGVFT
jgi:exonuclease VII large subunit